MNNSSSKIMITFRIQKLDKIKQWSNYKMTLDYLRKLLVQAVKIWLCPHGQKSTQKYSKKSHLLFRTFLSETICRSWNPPPITLKSVSLHMPYNRQKHSNNTATATYDLSQYYHSIIIHSAWLMFNRQLLFVNSAIVSAVSH